MQIEDKRKLHVPGHESHGVHICHRCGWPFPNPHPSAKHRRTHKKHCGKNQGYPLIEAATDVSDNKAHSAAADGELSDGDLHKHHSKMSGRDSNCQEGIKEKGDSAIDGEKGSSVRSDEEAVVNLANPAATGTTDADKAPESSPLPHQIQGSVVESMVNQMENGTELQNNAVICRNSADASSLNVRTDSLDELTIPMNGSCDSFFIEASSIYFEEKIDIASRQNVGNSPEVESEHNTEERNSLANDLDAALPIVEALESDTSKIAPKSALMGVSSEKEVPLTCASSIETESLIGAVSLKSWPTQEEKTDVERHEFDNGPSSDPHSFSLNVDTGEHLKADSIQVENPVGIAGVGIQENADESVHLIALLENIPERDISGVTDEVSGYCGTMEPDAIIADAESVLNPEDHLGDPNHREVQAQERMESIKSSKSALVFPSKTNVQESNLYLEETGRKSASSKFHDNDSSSGEDNGVKSIVVRASYCEGEADVREAEVFESCELEGLEFYPGDLKEDSVRADVIIFDGPITSSIQSEENKIEPSIVEKESCHELSDEVISEITIVAVSTAKWEVGTQANEATKVESGGHDAKHEEKNDSRMKAKINTETASGLAEANVPSYRDLEKSESEQKQELNASKGVSVVGTQANEATGTNNGNCDVAHKDTWINHNTVVKECSLEGAKIDYSDTNIMITSDPVCDRSEEQIQSLENLQKNEVEKEKGQELAESTLSDSTACTEEIDNTTYPSENIRLDHLSEVSKKRPIEPESGSDSDLSVTKTEVQIDLIKAESCPTKYIKKEPESFESREFELYNHDTQLLKSEEHATPLESCIILDESSTNNPTEGVSSFTQTQSLQDKNNHYVRKHDTDSSLEWVDIVSRTDALEVESGSVSDQSSVPSTINAIDSLPVLGIKVRAEIKPQTPEETHAANLMTGVSAEHRTDDSGLFETSSFMAHTGPDTQLISTDLESLQSSQMQQPSSTSEAYLESRKGNIETADNIVNWGSGKFHTPLKSLLAKEIIGSKETDPKEQDGVTSLLLPTLGSQSLEDGFPPKALNLSVTSGGDPEAKRAVQREWNSPARFPVSKNQKKRKPQWVPFMCCSSVN